MKSFALQFTKVDSKASLVHAFLQRATERGLQCRTLEALDIIEVGANKYLRLKIDESAEKLTETILSFFPERAVILLQGRGGYTCKMKNREGIVSFSTMQSVSLQTPMVFRGNAIPHWERQFLPKLQQTG